MPKHKISGSAHEDTLRKLCKENAEYYTISKTPLTKLKIKNGEIENYFNSSSDTLLYNALKQRLTEFDGNGKKAFAGYSCQ